MRIFVYILVILCCALNLKAQQNLFNVPSSDITAKSSHFLQYQINLSSNNLQNNFTYTYGLGKGFEGGINFYDLNFTNLSKPGLSENLTDINLPFSPLVMVNIQKGFELSKNFKIGIGTQTGSSVNFHLCNFSFINTNTSLFNNKIRLIGGGYYSNQAIAGKGNTLGALAGLEIPLLHDKITVTTDYVSGRNSLSVGVIGCAVKLYKHLVFSVGYQYAGYHSPNNNGLVFELTKI